MDTTIKISLSKDWEAFLKKALEKVITQIDLSTNLFGGSGPDLKPEFTEALKKYFGDNYNPKEALKQLKAEYESFLHNTDGQFRIDWFEDSEISNDEWYTDKERLLLAMVESILISAAIKKLMKTPQASQQ